MSRKPELGVRYVVGPDGSPLTVENLPKVFTGRWGSLNKAKIVAAVRGGLISLDEMSKRYSLPVEEVLNWKENTEFKNYKKTDWIESTENEKK